MFVILREKKPELVAIAEPASNRPKKRSRRAAPGRS